MINRRLLAVAVSAELSRYPTEEELNDYTTPLPWERPYYLIPSHDFMEPFREFYRTHIYVQPDHKVSNRFLDNSNITPLKILLGKATQ